MKVVADTNIPFLKGVLEPFGRMESRVADFETLAELAGKRVAVQLGTSGEALLADEEGQLALAKTFEGGEPITMENFNICGTELDAGGVDAVVIDLPVAQNLAKKFSSSVAVPAISSVRLTSEL